MSSQWGEKADFGFAPLGKSDTLFRFGSQGKKRHTVSSLLSREKATHYFGLTSTSADQLIFDYPNP
jgi:hypothetical protein